MICGLLVLAGRKLGQAIITGLVVPGLTDELMNHGFIHRLDYKHTLLYRVVFCFVFCKISHY